jgi:hypothetical protein
VLVTEVVTHANANAIDDAAAGCLVTVPTAFAFEAQVPK